MILVVCAALVVLSVPLTGGRLSALGELRLRGTAVVFAALLTQILVINVLPDAAPASLLAAIHLATYAPAVVFLFVNRAVRGLPLLGSGGLANLVAISANGGVMPASPHALATAGLASDAGQFVNSGAVPDARLPWLGDIFAIPAHWPLANVFSVGDILLVVGLAVLLHGACRRGGSAAAPAVAG